MSSSFCSSGVKLYILNNLGWNFSLSLWSQICELGNWSTLFSSMLPSKSHLLCWFLQPLWCVCLFPSVHLFHFPIEWICQLCQILVLLSFHPIFQFPWSQGVAFFSRISWVIQSPFFTLKSLSEWLNNSTNTVPLQSALITPAPVAIICLAASPLWGAICP